MSGLDIYIKPVKKALIAENRELFIKDVAEVVAIKTVADDVNAIKIMDMTAPEKTCYLVSVTDVIKLIKKKYPDYSVNNVGEMDTLVEFSPVKSTDNKYNKWLKIAFVSAVLFIGSATAIMSFYSDAQMSQVFENTYKILFGYENKNPLIIEIPYTIGLAFGILMFFNHFLGKKVTADPTPIEVQISLYETQVSDTLIDILDTKKERREEGEGQ